MVQDLNEGFGASPGPSAFGPPNVTKGFDLRSRGLLELGNPEPK